LEWQQKEKGSKGNPQSHAKPTWFIVPGELEGIILRKAEDLAKKKNLRAAYREKARDEKMKSQTKEQFAKENRNPEHNRSVKIKKASR
jgi:hypothetical protein